LSRPVFAVESANDEARMFDSLLSSASLFSLSTSPGVGATRFHLSGAFSPWPFVRSSVIVCPFRVI